MQYNQNNNCVLSESEIKLNEHPQTNANKDVSSGTYALGHSKPCRQTLPNSAPQIQTWPAKTVECSKR